ncbi:hypothetical protein NDU88_006578 [Pleurodeles waltl]|uniref:Uncharacterized protein n=1 Tax=Pleurodeles waltl TaxID=8319 RepID=A0AAV7NTI1_PLEWA|nr:hypothetical protein NDU88_006578 [Pleurodeles waltl]
MELDSKVLEALALLKQAGRMDIVKEESLAPGAPSLGWSCCGLLTAAPSGRNAEHVGELCRESPGRRVSSSVVKKWGPFSGVGVRGCRL